MHAGQGRREVCPASGTGRLCGKTNPLTPSAAERLNFPSDRDLFIDSVPMAWWDLSGGGRTRGFEDAPRRIFVWRRRLRRRRICAVFCWLCPRLRRSGGARQRGCARHCGGARMPATTTHWSCARISIPWLSSARSYPRPSAMLRDPPDRRKPEDSNKPVNFYQGLRPKTVNQNQENTITWIMPLTMKSTLIRAPQAICISNKVAP